MSVVVDFGVLATEGLRACAQLAPEASMTALEALAAAGVDVAGTAQWGMAFICRVEGRPAATEEIHLPDGGTVRESCSRTPSQQAYWSLWSATGTADGATPSATATATPSATATATPSATATATPSATAAGTAVGTGTAAGTAAGTGDWLYATSGAGDLRLDAGDVVGLAFTTGTAAAAAPALSAAQARSGDLPIGWVDRDAANPDPANPDSANPDAAQSDQAPSPDQRGGALLPFVALGVVVVGGLSAAVVARRRR